MNKYYPQKAFVSFPNAPFKIEVEVYVNEYGKQACTVIIRDISSNDQLAAIKQVLKI